MSSISSPSDLLLRERRNYKKILYNLSSAKNHLLLLKLCCHHHLIPKGLKLRINCVALASQETSLLQEFKNTILNTERELINNLSTHYEKIITTYEEKLQCNLTRINKIKVSANPTTLYYHDKVFQATRRNVENITKRKQHITENKLDKLYFDKYKHRRSRNNSIPTSTPSTQHNTSIQLPSNIISTDRQQNIQSTSITTANLHPLINNIPTSFTNNSISTVANSSEGVSSSSSTTSPIVSSSSSVRASVVVSGTSTASNSRTITSRFDSTANSIISRRNNSTQQQPPFFSTNRIPLRTLINNIRSATNNNTTTAANNNNNPPISSTSSMASSKSAVTSSITNGLNSTTNSTYLPNLPNLPSTTASLPYTTANPNLTNYLRARNTSYACTLTTTTARMDPSRRICNILTPVTTNTITLDNSTTTNIPICLPSGTRESTPTPPDHSYSIVTRSRARQHRL